MGISAVKCTAVNPSWYKKEAMEGSIHVSHNIEYTCENRVMKEKCMDNEYNSISKAKDSN